MSTNLEIPIPRPAPAPAPAVTFARPEADYAEALFAPRGAPGDFISDYVRYADVIEAPPEAHEAVGLQLLASVINPRVRIRNGAIEIPLDIWTLLLSGSGLGRNTLVSLSRPILKEADLSLLREASWGSAVAVYQEIAEHPNGLFVWPELSVVLKILSNPRFGGVKEWLTDRYDNWEIPDGIRYRRTGKTTDTPSIIFGEAPRINVLATSSSDWFTSSLEREDTTGGFVPRWMIVELSGPSKLIPKPLETDKSLINPLAAHLREAAKLEGEANLSQVEGLYGEWYREAYDRFSKQPNRALAMPFFNRLRTLVLKLAVVYEVSRSLSLQVSTGSMLRAIKTANKLELTIFGLLPTGMSREGSEVDKIAVLIRSRGAIGISQSDLTKAFQHLKDYDRRGRITTLCEAGTVRYLREKPPEERGASMYIRIPWLSIDCASPMIMRSKGLLSLSSASFNMAIEGS